MSKSADFRTLQYAFAAHLRDPAGNPPPPGLEERRLAIYRDLFFSNIENFANGFFPVLRTQYTAEQWRALIRDFFARHQSRTPYFLEIAEEFLHFLKSERGEHPDDPPYAWELAHYEWLELAVDVAEDVVPTTGYDPDGDVLDGVPVITPALALASYCWPVHRIAAAFRPQEPLAEPVWLVVYRDRDDAVRFLEINAATARLITLMRLADEQGQAVKARSGRELGAQLAAELARSDVQAVVAAAADMLLMLREQGLLFGVQRSLPARERHP